MTGPLMYASNADPASLLNLIASLGENLYHGVLFCQYLGETRARLKSWLTPRSL